jgi:thioredoxin-like negative regulator of GroEL
MYPVALAAAVLAGCSGTQPGAGAPHSVESSAVRALLDRANEQLEAGARDEAARLCRDALRTDPEGVAAHRAIQNLELAEHRRGELLVKYLAWRDEAPAHSDRWYLWGRLLSAPEGQRAAFERARALDPTSPWPLLGLAHVALGAGDYEQATRLFREGRDRAPDQPDLELGLLRSVLPNPMHWNELDRVLRGVLDAERWDVARLLLLAELDERREKPRDAVVLLARLLARVPKNAEVATSLSERFAQSGTADDAQFLLRELSDASGEPAVRPLLARCHAMLGDSGAALQLWGDGADLDAKDREWRRRLLVARGDVAAALALERDRFAALTALGADVSQFDAAVRLAKAGAGGDAVALAAAFRRLGWLDEALSVLRPVAERGDRADAVSLLAGLFEQRRLEAELEILARDTYRAFDAHAPTPTFDRFLRRVGETTRRAVGDDLTAGDDVVSFWPIGELLDPASQGGLPAWFRARGRLLVAGSRGGSPPELYLAPVVATMRVQPADTPLSFTEGVTIPGYLEHRGAHFSGAALVRFVYLDVAAIEDDVTRLLQFERRFGPAADRIRADPLLPARDGDERRSIDEPAEVATKLELKGLAAWRVRHPDGARATLLAEGIDAVLSHELGHLEDAQRFLPLGRHLGAILWQLTRLGFSARRAEEWLELRAECTALAHAQNPWLVLASCASQLGGGEPTLTPHAGGYRELMARFVAVLDDDPAAFPSLRRDHVLVQQLDRLSEAELREAARRVLDDLGIEEPAEPVTPPRGGGP